MGCGFGNDTLYLRKMGKEDTFKILDEIKRVLNKGGVLFLRVNSVEDVNHGAMQGEEIEHHLFKTSDGRYKRFFDEDDIDFFFKDWKKIYVNEESMKRYKEEKILWKCAFMEV